MARELPTLLKGEARPTPLSCGAAAPSRERDRYEADGLEAAEDPRGECRAGEEIGAWTCVGTTPRLVLLLAWAKAKASELPEAVAPARSLPVWSAPRCCRSREAGGARGGRWDVQTSGAFSVTIAHTHSHLEGSMG